MNQVSSLNTLTYYFNRYDLSIQNISFIYFPRARDCLTDLSELHFSTEVHSELFYELSQICHNLRSLTIIFEVKFQMS